MLRRTGPSLLPTQCLRSPRDRFHAAEGLGNRRRPSTRVPDPDCVSRQHTPVSPKVYCRFSGAGRGGAGLGWLSLADASVVGSVSACVHARSSASQSESELLSLGVSCSVTSAASGGGGGSALGTFWSAPAPTPPRDSTLTSSAGIRSCSKSRHERWYAFCTRMRVNAGRNCGVRKDRAADAQARLRTDRRTGRVVRRASAA